MSCNFYNKLPKDQQPQLKPIQGYRAANGSPVQCLGKGMFKFKLGNSKIKKPLVVAAIVDDVLLGADILQNDPNRRARLLLDEERMILNGNSIPLTLLGKSKSCRKVTAADNYIIPGMVEMIVDAYIEDYSDDSKNTAVLIEPNTQLGECTLNYGFLHCQCSLKHNRISTIDESIIRAHLNKKDVKKTVMVAFVHACIIVKCICLLGQTHFPYLEQKTV